MPDAIPDLKTRIEASPLLPFKGIPFRAQAPAVRWQSGAVSGVAIGKDGAIYEIQRSNKVDPILALNSDGRILRSWGKGDFTIPHTIRIDPEGNIWTVDAGSSIVIKYSQAGKKLLAIHVGEQPDNGSTFHGATDVAVASNGHIFIADGYGNARILEYSANGKRLRQWGRHGVGPGEFNLPHALAIDPQGILYVADRENGRIEEFDLSGQFLREISHLGRIYSFKLTHGVLWASMGPFDQPPGSPGWVVKLDPDTGEILGHLNVAQDGGGHSLDVTPSGEPIITLANELLWFKQQ